MTFWQAYKEAWKFFQQEFLSQESFAIGVLTCTIILAFAGIVLGVGYLVSR